jgi:hypothetical protein
LEFGMEKEIDVGCGDETLFIIVFPLWMGKDDETSPLVWELDNWEIITLVEETMIDCDDGFEFEIERVDDSTVLTTVSHKVFGKYNNTFNKQTHSEWQPISVLKKEKCLKFLNNN